MHAPTPLRLHGGRERFLYGASFATIALCVALWIRAKIVGEDERQNAERRALFVGLWPPMFWLIADTVSRAGRRRVHIGRRKVRAARSVIRSGD
jgi:hypothetical protein